jgi:hypothetical protein
MNRNNKGEIYENDLFNAHRSTAYNSPSALARLKVLSRAVGFTVGGVFCLYLLTGCEHQPHIICRASYDNHCEPIGLISKGGDKIYEYQSRPEHTTGGNWRGGEFEHAGRWQ